VVGVTVAVRTSAAPGGTVEKLEVSTTVTGSVVASRGRTVEELPTQLISPE